MNSQISKSDIKGEEIISLTIWPSDNLERAFFTALFEGGQVVVENIPNSDEVVIKKVKTEKQ